MSDDSPDYAHGHYPQRAQPIKHHEWVLENAHGPLRLHITTDSGLHYNFSLMPGQAFFSERRLRERLSRMSDTKPASL